MVYLFLSVSVLVFLACLRLTGIIPVARDIVAESGAAGRVMTSSELTDDEKEARMQAVAKKLLVAFFSIVVRSVICLAIPFAVVMAGVWFGFYTDDGAATAALNWYFLIGSTVVAVVIMKVTH